MVIAAESGDFEALVVAGAETWGRVLATDFPTRADAIAAEVEDARPDVLALQEVALWRGQFRADSVTPFPTPATLVLQDFLAILLDALAARGLDYVVLAELETADVELPTYDPTVDDLADLRFTDRDVVLVRADVLGRDLVVDDVAQGLFDTRIELDSGIVIARGWIQAELRVEGASLRLVATHLDDVHPVRAGQLVELLAGPLDASGRVLLLGDLNSDALHGAGPDDTPTYDDLLTAGLHDAWSIPRPGEPGETWGHDVLLVDPLSTFWERIDFALLRGGFAVEGVARYGYDPAEMVDGLWPSDHAGLAAALRLE